MLDILYSYQSSKLKKNFIYLGTTRHRIHKTREQKRSIAWTDHEYTLKKNRSDDTYRNNASTGNLGSVTVISLLYSQVAREKCHRDKYHSTSFSIQAICPIEGQSTFTPAEKFQPKNQIRRA